MTKIAPLSPSSVESAAAPARQALHAVEQAVRALRRQPNVRTPSATELRRMAEPFGTRTECGAVNFVSTVKHRSAGATVYVGSPAVSLPSPSTRQREILAGLPHTLELVQRYLGRAPLVCVERTMGDNDTFVPRCATFVSTHRPEMVRLAYMWGETLRDVTTTAPGPEQCLVYLPEWQEKDRQVLVFPEIGVTYVLGSDYFGESKKGHLRMAMWHAKQQGMLGLHAGSKLLRARDRQGRIRTYGMAIFGLTATGKTTHACHHHGLTEPGEGIAIVQDDVVFLRDDGSMLGSERGFYIKTDSLSPMTQPLLYRAATQPDAIYENVLVDYEGRADFADETLTGNGRCIIRKRDLGAAASEGYDTPPVAALDGLIVAFIVRRNTVVPIASRLTPEQAAAAFMLGESIESSGSDPRRAGESVREVGTNPFIIGDKAQEGNRFYEILQRNAGRVQCYLLNTGGVGEIAVRQPDGTRQIRQPVTRVEIMEMAAIIRGIARGTIVWEREPHFGTEVPVAVEGVEMARFRLERFYSAEQVATLVEELRRERVDYIQRFAGLHPAIAQAVTR